ncbi:complement factor H-related protein 2-like isoform X2 [Megalobrama amblycephala]|uniref:complement factor H-related protein 2-like isoform X2 n=1 Tax=Megalobrama amblycephala TaxID=75352 RepID=UPI002013F227|nr:complement factor H-related protein 2-like isoform X2 [Megalobrama amblycephala]
MNISFGKQVKMKCEIFLFLQLMIMGASTKEVTCEGEQLLNVDIVVGYPGIAPPYKPGHILVFRCTDVNLKMYGQRTIECLSSGKWDNPYPKCGEINIKIERFPDIEGPIKPGHKLTFSCNGQGQKLKGQREITCLSNGEWSSPFPKCEEVVCVANLTGKKIIESEVAIIPGHTLNLACDGQGLVLKGQREITCLSNGEWSSPFPKCEMRTECGPPPNQENADTTEIPKNEYSYGQKVEYMCFNKFTMLGSPYLICAQGEWKGYFTCLKPCTVTVEVLDERGIQLRWRGREKIFSPHGDRIEFSCKRGKSSIGLIQTCNDGVMNLPLCV